MKHPSTCQYLWIIISLLILSCSDRQQKHETHQKPEITIYNCLIDSLTNKDTLEINYETFGCEHHISERILLYKLSDTLIAELTIHNHFGKDKFLTLRNSLSDSSIFAYQQFENHGRNYKSSDSVNCTNTDKYNIKLKSQSIKFEDFSCEFDGYYNLKKTVFGKKELEEFETKIYR